MALTEAEMARLDDLFVEAISFAFSHGRHDEEEDGFARDGLLELLRLARIGQEREAQEAKRREEERVVLRGDATSNQNRDPK